MCNVNPGSSCVPPRRSLCAPVRPTVSFPGKVDNLFSFICLVTDFRGPRGAAESRQSPGPVLFIETRVSVTCCGEQRASRCGHCRWRRCPLFAARHYSRLFNSLALKSINFASVPRTTAGVSFSRYSPKCIFPPHPLDHTRQT